MKRSPLKRYKPMKKKRDTPRRGEPTNEEKEEARRKIYDICGGQCELKVHDKHIEGVLPWDGSVFERFHLAHVHAKRRFGWPTEGPDRMRGACFHCHIEAVHNKGVKIPPIPETSAQ